MSTPLFRRPNGRAQACDPCRNRKVGCDNTQPVCDRCRKRNKDSECSYTISAYTLVSRSARARAERSGSGSGAGAINTTPPTSSSTINSSPAFVPAFVPALVPATTAVTPIQTEAADHVISITSLRPRSEHHHTPPGSSGPSSSRPSPAPPAPPGYLGFTSHSTVYEETRGRLSLLQGGPIITSDATPNTGPHHARTGSNAPEILSGPLLSQSMIVLRNLPDLSKNVTLPRDNLHPREAWGRLAAQRILNDLTQYFSVQERSELSLERLAQVICRNTARSVDDNMSDPREWLGQFIGQNLRWESLALIFTYRGLFSDVSVEDNIRGDRNCTAWRTIGLECLNLCVDLSKRMSGGNLMLLYVYFQRIIMESLIFGDAALSSWTSDAECAALLTFLGLHDEEDTPNYIPTFCSELRRRLVSYIFNSHQLAVEFQGRPPLISHRFLSTPLPLDVSEQDLLSDAETLQRVARELDHDGWNRSQTHPHHATMVRARAKLAYLKDEIMEIALGKSKEPDINTLIDIKHRHLQLLATFPPSLTYNSQDLDSSSTLPIETVHYRTFVQMEQLQSLFLIERLLLRRGQPDSGQLLLISFELVQLALACWFHRDRFASLRTDLEWLLMAYAAPGGGILCMELLHPTENHAISRSSIIQQLSLLVGFFTWVSPNAPNADLCGNCRTLIQSVLDHTLNGAPASGVVMSNAEATEGFFNFELLDTFSWLRTDEHHGNQHHDNGNVHMGDTTM